MEKDTRFVEGTLAILHEIAEGGQPGEQTFLLDGTAADGSGNHGLLATLSALNPQQASSRGPLGLSVAAHAAHVAFSVEVLIRWVGGDRGPFDWPDSFRPAEVDAAGWLALQQRLTSAYQELERLARSAADWDQDAVSGLVAAVAHVAYHLGAIRQAIKLV